MMRHRPLPKAFITVEYGDGVASLFGAAASAEQRARDATEAALAALLDSLGVPGTPHVRFRYATPAEGFRVFVGRDALPLSKEAFRRLYRVTAGLGAAQLASESDGADDWWGQLGQYVLHDDDGLGSFLTFLVAAVRGSVQSKPAHVLGDFQVVAWIERATEDGHDRERFAHHSGQVATVLRALLNHGIALTDIATISRYTVDGLSRGRDAMVIAEALITRLQPLTLDIELHPDWTAPLLGLPSDGLPKLLETCPTESDLRRRFELMRDGLFYDLGVRIPPIRFVAAADVPERAFRVRSGVLVCAPWAALAPDELLVDQDSDGLERVTEIPSHPAAHPYRRGNAAIIKLGDEPRLEGSGLTIWDPMGYMILAIAADIRRHAAVLVDIDAVEGALAQLDEVFPDLVRAVLEKFSASKVTQVLRRLLEHEVSVRNLRAILELLLAYDHVSADTQREVVVDRRLAIDTILDPDFEPDAVERYTEFVRCGLRTWISHKYSGVSTDLAVLTVDRHIEEAILDELAYRQGLGRGAPIGPKMERIRSAVGSQQSRNLAWLPILTFSQVASFLRTELRAEFPDVAVVAYQELAPDVNIHAVGRISFE